MQLPWLFVCFVAIFADLNYEETDVNDLVVDDIVRIKFNLYETYLKDEPTSTSPELANSDYFLWTIGSNVYGTTFVNVGSGRNLKARVNGAQCFTGVVSGNGEAAAWNITQNTLNNAKESNGCCSVESSEDSEITHSSCNNSNQYVTFERRIPNLYFLVDVNKTASEAAHHCKALGSTLATITSEEDHLNVLDLCNSTDSIGCWIGLNDITTEGTWTWRDGTTYKYNNFLNNESYWAWDCVFINKWSIMDAIPGHWIQDRCSEWEFPFVCIGNTIKVIKMNITYHLII